jgi:hypothetical protein
MKTERYIIRTKDGLMIMRASGEMVQRMFKEFEGTWRTYADSSGKRTVCYELEKDSSWGIEMRNDIFYFYLWKGTKIIKE